MESRQLCVQISRALHRSSHIGQQGLPEVVVSVSPSIEAYRWDPETLLIDLPGQGHGSGRHASHVGVMGPRCHIPEESGIGLPLLSRLSVIYRRNQSDVREVGSASKRVVQYDHVARVQLSNLLKCGLDAHGHGPQMDRHVIP